MERIKPKVGQVVEGGEILAVIRAPEGAANRHLSVRLRCSCGKEYEAEWYRVAPRADGKRPHTRSCGHLRSDYWDGKARRAESWTRRKIFDYAATHGRQAAANLFSVPKIFVDFLCRLHWRVLAKLPQQVKAQVYQLANRERWHLPDIGRKFQRSIAEVRAILIIVRRAIESKKAASLAAGWNDLTDAKRAAVQNVEVGMTEALKATAGNEFWRQPGCFAAGELTIHRDGTCGGTFSWLLSPDATDSRLLRFVDPQLRRDFAKAVKDTRRYRRALRRRIALERMTAKVKRVFVAPQPLPVAA